MEPIGKMSIGSMISKICRNSSATKIAPSILSNVDEMKSFYPGLFVGFVKYFETGFNHRKCASSIEETSLVILSTFLPQSLRESLSISFVSFFKQSKILGRVILFMCGHRLHGLINFTFGLST